MKKIKFFILVSVFIFLVVSFTSCKEKKAFVEPTFVFMKWSDAIKKLNYRYYSECEVFPKERSVFSEIYGDHYYSDVFVKNLGDYDEENIRTDSEGNRFNHRKVYFECRRISRKTGMPVQNMKGDVLFVKYLSGARADKGWLMFNRTIIRSGSGKNK